MADRLNWAQNTQTPATAWISVLAGRRWLSRCAVIPMVSAMRWAVGRAVPRSPSSWAPSVAMCGFWTTCFSSAVGTSHCRKMLVAAACHECMALVSRVALRGTMTPDSLLSMYNWKNERSRPWPSSVSGRSFRISARSGSPAPWGGGVIISLR